MLLVDNRIFGLITAMLAIVIFLLTFMFPIINIGSIIFQVWALRRGESKWKNILMMMITVVCAAVIFALGVRFWQGAMSV